MRYYDDMRSKYGFSDGECEPAGIDAYREVYLITLNALLAETESGVRVVAFHRPGLHNGCLISTVTRAFYETLEETTVLQGLPWEALSPGLLPDEALDEGYHAAVDLAYELDVDTCVEVTVTINHPALHDLLVNTAP